MQASPQTGLAKRRSKRLHRSSRIVGRPNFFADCKEIRVRSQRLDQSDIQGTFGNDWHLNHLGPPNERVKIRGAAIAQDAAAHRAEADVVGTGFGGSHTIMAGRSAERAHNGIFAQVGPCLTHCARAVRKVHTIKAQPLDQADMRVNHHGQIAGMGQFTDAIGGTGEGAFVFGRKREAQAGHLVNVQNGGQKVRKCLQLKRGGRYKIDLWLLGKCGVV